MTNFKTHKEIAAMISKDSEIQRLFISQWENIVNLALGKGFKTTQANDFAYDVLITDNMFYKGLSQASNEVA